MVNNNHLTLAVAGSRKTQGIIEACASAELESRILIVTYTNNNQRELKSRLAKYAGDHYSIEVLGWFSFLIRHFVKPYIPLKEDGARVRGFDFHGDPGRFAKVDSMSRYFTKSSSVYRLHLPQVAHQLVGLSQGAVMDRLSRLYDIVYVDEVQDLCGYDLEVLKLLMESTLPLQMVGDVRQAVIATNPQEAKNAKYRFMQIWNWFRKEESAGRLTIEQRNQTWRCRAEIAAFADSLFDESWGFAKTESLNSASTLHDGIFLVHPTHLQAYVNQYRPLMLRYNKSSGKNLPYEFMNYKESKGLTAERVCILPTAPILKYLQNGTLLDDQQASPLYVAVTRAEQSVAFIAEKAVPNIPFWEPSLGI